MIIACPGAYFFCPASEKNLGLKPVFFAGGICRRLRRGAAIRFRQKTKLAISINGEIASRMVKSRRPEDLAKFTRPHDSRAHTAERHTTKKGKKEKGEVFSVKPVETEHAERSHSFSDCLSAPEAPVRLL